MQVLTAGPVVPGWHVPQSAEADSTKGLLSTAGQCLSLREVPGCCDARAVEGTQVSGVAVPRAPSL